MLAAQWNALSTAQFDVTWAAGPTPPETQPPFYSIHDSRAQDLLAARS